MYILQLCQLVLHIILSGFLRGFKMSKQKFEIVPVAPAVAIFLLPPHCRQWCYILY